MNKWNKKFWVGCTEEEYNKIQELAKQEGISMGDLAKVKILNLVPVKYDEIKEYDNKIKDKKGNIKIFKKRMLSTKTILKPAESVLA